MCRLVLASLFILTSALALCSPGHAQRAAVRATLAPERVTILTNGIADPAGPAVSMINDVAARLSHSGMRVLPIAGEGALGNLRDLLQLQGVDFAILNNDILAYLDLTGEYPDARRRIRYVTHLLDQTVYLLARKEFVSLEELRGRKVAAGQGAITARTLFGLHKVAAEVQTIDSERLAQLQTLRGVDGIVLLGGEVARLDLGLAALSDFHLLAIPPSPALQKVYQPARIAATEFPGLARPEGPLDTIAVSTLLAVFDWTPRHSRHANITAFIKGLFASLPALRQTPAGAAWRQADVKAEIVGWTRYSGAEPDKLLSKTQLAGLSVVDKPAPVPPPAQPAAAARAPQPKPISMLVVKRAPLADERAADGGLIPALLAAGIAMAGPVKGQRPAIEWSKSDASTPQLLAKETAADVLLPWDLADCERPSDLSQTQAVLCDRATFSDPIMQVVIALFSIAEGDFKFDSNASIKGRSICVPLDRDIADLAIEGRNWIAEKHITLIRQPSLIDCVSLVQRREADAFVATDVEGWHLLKQLGIGPLFVMAERPLGARTIHAAVWKAHPQAAHMLETVNKAIRQIKDSGAHANLVRQHLMPILAHKTDIR